VTLLTDITIFKFTMLARMRSRRRSRPGNGSGPASGQTSTPTASRARRPAGGLAGAARPAGCQVLRRHRAPDRRQRTCGHGGSEAQRRGHAGRDLPALRRKAGATTSPGSTWKSPPEGRAPTSTRCSTRTCAPLSGNAVLSGVPVRLEPRRQPRRGGIVKPQVTRGSNLQKAPKGRQQTGRSAQQVFLVKGDAVLFEQPHQLVLE